MHISEAYLKKIRQIKRILNCEFVYITVLKEC